MHALDLQTGRLAWKTRIGQVITAPPVVSGSTIWIQSGIIHALTATDGKILWRAGLGDGAQSAPVVTEDGVYLASMQGDIYALA